MNEFFIKARDEAKTTSKWDDKAWDEISEWAYEWLESDKIRFQLKIAKKHKDAMTNAACAISKQQSIIDKLKEALNMVILDCTGVEGVKIPYAIEALADAEKME